MTRKPTGKSAAAYARTFLEEHPRGEVHIVWNASDGAGHFNITTKEVSASA